MENLKNTLTTKEALEEIMSMPKWYAALPKCSAQLANYYKTQAENGTLSQALTDRILSNYFEKNPLTWNRKKPLSNG